MHFSVESFPHFVSEDICLQFNRVWQRLAEPGYWWTAQQRKLIVEAMRAAKPRPVYDRQREAVSNLSHEESSQEYLSPLLLDTIERVSTESGQLDGEWCKSVCERVGEGAYVELVALIILVLPIDRFCMALGRDLQPLPEPQNGEPLRAYPEDIVANGAWVRQTKSAVANKELVNVSRALSICPIENGLRRDLVDAMYMEGHSFFDKLWHRKSLSRTQLEIAATRTSVINRCFYCANGHTMILDMAAKASGDAVDLKSPQGQEVNDIGVEHGELILDYTEFANREPEKAYEQHAKLIEVLGERAAMELAAVVAIFNGLNRTSDPTGVPMEETLMAYGRLGNKTESLGLAEMTGINNTERPSLLQSIWILVKFQIRRIMGEGQ
ncbi:alkylhydroperoxidase-related (seleno)protein [uncultured Pseudoteredinibacter sp.]|uniref:alkylhydroperoxidase-related (seleno)protein n=1 Tax=uncultured Pseudoteredinibacter sp. TaxID=1641701 RepID=UPI0026076FE7|nr:alkylhydroperoxidase-related (seleno)protein [uncultured Pseudoteredinibacter sp.]